MSTENSLSIVRAFEQTIADGEYAGRTFRHTNDVPRRSSVIDWIAVITGLNSKSSAQMLRRIVDNDSDDKANLKLNYVQFIGQGQRMTPVAEATDMINILSKLPKKYTKTFQQERDDLMKRYLTGDTGLIPEVLRRTGEPVESVIQSIDLIEAKYKEDLKAMQAKLDAEKRARNLIELAKEDIEDRAEKCIITRLCKQWRDVDLTDFARSCSIYLIYVGEYINKDGFVVHVFKFGRSEDMIKRMVAHKHTFEIANLVFCQKVLSGLYVENLIKEFSRLHELKCEIEISDDHTETEILMTNSEISIIDVVAKLTLMCNKSTTYAETEVLILKKDKEIAEYKARAEIAEMKVKLLENGIKV